MIAGTYILSGAMLAVTAFLFKDHTFSAWGPTVTWCVIFLFASAGASAAYLTVSEIFPVETRALAIAIFYAMGAATRDELGRRTLRRQWGPGRFNRALREAILQGRVRRSGRGRYEPARRPSSSSLQPEK